jgi:hypothetical protein
MSCAAGTWDNANECTTCVAVANAATVTCTSATNSAAATCATGYTLKAGTRRSLAAHLASCVKDTVATTAAPEPGSTAPSSGNPTVSSATSTTVIGVNVANIVSQNIYVDVQITDNSASVTKYLVKGAVIPNGSSTVLVGGDRIFNPK